MELDRIDRAILAELQRDGRLPIATLARRVGLSPTPCLRRVKRLEADGTIRGYVALVDPQALGLGVTVYVFLTLSPKTDEILTEFDATVRGWPEVMECHLMTGIADYLLRVIVPDLPAYERFLREKLTRVDEIANIQTAVALRSVVAQTALPVAG